MQEQSLKILVVDDEKELAQQVCENLELEGFSTKAHFTSVDAIDIIHEFKPDVIVLDKQMPQMDGIDLVKEIRGTDIFQSISVIMLTACDTKFDKLWAFNSGVDDYISKPFDFDELVMRIRAASKKKVNIQFTRSMNYDSLGIEINDQFIYIGNEPVSLTTFEFDFLKELIEKDGNILSTDEIETKLFKSHDQKIDVEKEVFSLKKKLKDLGNKIKTVRGVGYRLVT